MVTQHRYLIVFLVMSMGITFLCLITIGCATKKLTQIDPPSLQIDPSEGPWEPKDETITDTNNAIDKWEVKRSSSSDCQVQDPATGKWYPSTVDENDKVEFSDKLLKEMSADRQDYWKNNPEAFQEWLDQHPKQKEKHEKWLEEQRARRALLLESEGGGGSGGGGGGH